MKEETKIFKALSNESRLKIVRLLLKGDHHACKISQKLHKKQPTVSLQLTKLTHLGIVKVEKKGNHRSYSLKNQLVKDIINLIDNKKKNIKNNYKGGT